MLRCGCYDHLQNAFTIAQDIRIPEAENPVAFRFKPTIAFDVSFVFRMLSAVDFDDQMPLVTNEVDNEAPNRCLSSKAKTAQSMSA